MGMRSVSRYFLRPLELAFISGIFLFISNMTLGNGLYISLQSAVLPALILVALFITCFLLILFITWITSSTTEV